MKLFSKIFFLVVFFSFPAFAGDLTIKWNSKEGLAKLEASQYKNDFYQMADHFQPQINPVYCSIASSVIILNTINDDKEIASQKDLEIVKPKALGGGVIPFKSFSQLTFLNDQTDKIKNRQVINLKNITKENESDAKNFDSGLNLRDLAQILQTYQLKTKITYAIKIDEKFLAKFRKLLKEILSEDKKFLVANFDGKELNLKTRGHISPISAFDETSDSVLILDVAGHKNGWYWVKVSDLLKAMNTKDGENYRGYLVVGK